MRMMLTYQNGRRVEGLLVAVLGERMRVVLPGESDTAELSRHGDGWRAENGDSLEIEAVTSLEGLDCAEILAGFAPRAMGAGQSF